MKMEIIELFNTYDQYLHKWLIVIYYLYVMKKATKQTGKKDDFTNQVPVKHALD